MPSIIRDSDNIPFITPDYRELITKKQQALLKKELHMLAAQYGQFAYIRKNNQLQFEVAFSHDAGILLGESIWQHFKMPSHLIYCELLPNQVEAILVVIKSGSIHIDTTVSIDAIEDELIIYSTGDVPFDIYIHGNVPISRDNDIDGFHFDDHLVKSFTVLPESVFYQLSTLNAPSLLPIDKALKKQGIGSNLARNMLTTILVLSAAWVGWHAHYDKPVVTQEKMIKVVNPYARYTQQLLTPAPDQEITQLVNTIIKVSTAPGWQIKTITYTNPTFTANVTSKGGTLDLLTAWSVDNNITTVVDQAGVTVSSQITVPKRGVATDIYNLQSVVGAIVDRINRALGSNNLKLNPIISYKQYSEMSLSINLQSITPTMLLHVGEQLKDLPVVLTQSSLTISDNGFISGQLKLNALGN